MFLRGVLGDAEDLRNLPFGLADGGPLQAFAFALGEVTRSQGWSHQFIQCAVDEELMKEWAIAQDAPPEGPDEYELLAAAQAAAEPPKKKLKGGNDGIATPPQIEAPKKKTLPPPPPPPPKEPTPA